MKRFLSYIACTALVVVLAAPQAWSFGMGLNKLGGLDNVQQSPTLNFSSLFDRLVYNLTGNDLVVDTAVAKNRLFNYRLNIACDSGTAYRDFLSSRISYTVNRLMWSNTFGFGLVRSRFMRVWAGPQLSLSYEFANKDNRVFRNLIFHKIGPVIGANIHTGEFTTISIEMGFRTGFGLDLRKSGYNTFTAAKPEPIAAIKLIFRAWDMFIPAGA
jgi:hypothetical protein